MLFVSRPCSVSHAPFRASPETCTRSSEASIYQRNRACKNVQRPRCRASVTATASVSEAVAQGSAPFQKIDSHAMFSGCLTLRCCRRRSGSRRTRSWRSSSMRCVRPQRQWRSSKSTRPLLFDAFSCARCSGATVGGGWFSSRLSTVREVAHGERQMAPCRTALHPTMCARPVLWRRPRVLKEGTSRQVLEPRPSSDLEHSINQEYPSRLLSSEVYQAPPVLNDNHLSRFSPATYRTGSAPSCRSTTSRRRHQPRPLSVY